MKSELYPYHPVTVLAEIQKTRVRRTLLPILVIVACIFVIPRFPYPELKIIPVLALVYYLYIRVLLRTLKVYPPDDNGGLLAPICGVVKDIRAEGFTNVIVIAKSAFQAADIRSGHNDDLRAPQAEGEFPKFGNNTLDTEWEIHAKGVEFYENHPNLRAMLIGIIPGNGECVCRIPLTLQITVSVGDKVTAGETELCRPVPVAAPAETEETE